MKYGDIDFEVVRNSGIERHLCARISGADLEERVGNRLLKAQKDFVCKGFRPGKVPMQILRKRIGKHTEDDEVREIASHALKEYLTAHGEQVLTFDRGNCKVATEEDGGRKIDFRYACKPEIPEIDLSGIKLEKLQITPSAVLQEEVETLIFNTATAKFDVPPDYVIRSGDLVRYSFEIFFGESDEPFYSSLETVSIASERLPGSSYCRLFVGAKLGDEIVFDTFLDQLPDGSNMFGIPVLVRCKLDSIREKVVQVHDPEVRERLESEGRGGKESLRQLIGNRIDGLCRREEKKFVNNQLFHEIVPRLDFDVPENELRDELIAIKIDLLSDPEFTALGYELDIDSEPEEQVRCATEVVRTRMFMDNYINRSLDKGPLIDFDFDLEMNFLFGAVSSDQMEQRDESIGERRDLLYPVAFRQLASSAEFAVRDVDECEFCNESVKFFEAAHSRYKKQGN